MPKKLTTEQFIERSKHVHGCKFTYDRTIYTNSSSPVIITCIVHGDITVNPNNHINNKSGCIHCSGLAKKTTHDFIHELQKQHGDAFTYDRTNYINDSTPVVITCKHHGDFSPIPSNILRGSGCPRCAVASSADRLRKPIDQFIAEATNVHAGKYDYSLVEYVNSVTKIKIICPTHGLFTQTPTAHISQRCGCPMCSSSKGELAIEQWLIKQNIVYIKQHTFPDCRDKGVLRFDFFLPEHNVLIEYNGIQHYRNVPLIKYSNDTFESIQRRDAIKVKYAKDKGLCLITVPYNVNTIVFLSNQLSDMGFSTRLCAGS